MPADDDARDESPSGRHPGRGHPDGEHSDEEEAPGALSIRTLRDALGIGLELIDLFGHEGDCCALWLGSSDASMRDFVICHEDRGRDADRLVRYGAISASVLHGVTDAVLWRTAADLTDAPALAAAFFDHQRQLAAAGVTLVDEIALGHDELRSLAVTSFADREGWDDVTALAAPTDDGGAPWAP
jgi:hypothetical protein